MVIQCCVCLKVKEENRWVIVEEPLLVMQYASHTYCPRCMEASLRALRQCSA